MPSLNDSICLFDIILVAVQVLTLLALIVYTAMTWKMAKAASSSARTGRDTLEEMTTARVQSRAPFVIINFELHPQKPFIDIVVRNTGIGLAKDVKFSFDPPLRNSNVDELKELFICRAPLSLLPPGAEIRSFFDTWFSLSDEMEMPWTYNVLVSYSGPEDETYSRMDCLDLRVFRGMSRIGEKGANEIAGLMEKLTRTASEIEDHLQVIKEQLNRGLYIMNPEMLLTPCDSTETAKLLLIEKLHEASVTMMVLDGGRNDHMLNPFPGEVRSRAAQLSLQIASLSGRASSLLSQAQIDLLKEVADCLFQIGAFFHWIGKDSMVEFRSLVEKLNILVSSALKELQAG